MQRLTAPLVTPTAEVLQVLHWVSVPLLLPMGRAAAADALGDGAAGDADREGAVVWLDAMVGFSALVLSGRRVWLVVWCSAWTVGAGYPRRVCWCGCAGGGGLSAWWRWWRRVALWSWRWRWVVRGRCVAGGVEPMWGSARWVLGGRGLVWVRVLIRSWRGLLGVSGQLICCRRAHDALCCLVGRGWCCGALRGWSGAWPAWVVLAQAGGVGCWACVRRACGGPGRGAWRCGQVR